MVVFNGTVKTTNGKLFNDIQLIGPILQKCITETLINFRTGKVALRADIVKIFRQMLINLKRYAYQLIILCSNGLEPLRDYCITKVIYGLASSPNNINVLLECTGDHENNAPEAVQIIREVF